MAENNQDLILLASRYLNMTWEMTSDEVVFSLLKEIVYKYLDIDEGNGYVMHETTRMWEV